MTSFSAVVSILFMCVLAVWPLSAAAQQPYPAKPIRMIVPFPPGGSIDPIARMVAQKLSENLGRQVVVDNRSGANGVIGTELVARAAPDGYTLIHLGASTHVVNSLLMRNLPYDSFKDFAPVAAVQRSNYVLVIHPSLPAKDLKGLVALAKARPGQIDYASSGSGNMNHLAAELFNMLTGVKTHHVPYKGGGQALTDVVSGQVHMHFSVIISCIPHVSSGRLRAIAIGGENRFPALSQVPTFAEAGLPGFTLKPWQGVLAPARTPREIVERLSVEIGQIVTLPEIREKLAALGMEPLIANPEQFAALMAEDRLKSAEVIKVAKIRLD
jgi:tripartite-type tricarboxylate transporter receptor subunit TctC